MNAPQDIQHMLTVYLGAVTFGLPVLHIQEVLKTPPLTYVPMLPPEVRGVINLRGRVVTAIDLYNAAGSAEPAAMSVVMEERGEVFSLLVDKVGDVHAVPAADIGDIPPTVSEDLKKIASGVFHLKEGIIIVLSPRMLLDNRRGAG